MKTLKKNIIFFIAALTFMAISVLSFSFDWPQEDAVQSDSFHSFFGQLRGNTISNSLIFGEPSTIKSCDEGYLSMAIIDISNDSDFFPSALGNFIILSHQDNLATVYGNLEKQSVINMVKNDWNIKKNQVIGTTENSAWQQGRSSLEFQVIDIKTKTSINPRVLMPRIGKEMELTTSGVTLIGKNEKKYELSSTKNIPYGTYKIYQKRLPVAVPYKTQIFLNGIMVDSIRFDILTAEENQICVQGNKKYNKEVLYPDNTLMLIGEAIFPVGQTHLQIILKDINDKTEYTTNYQILVR